MHDLVIINDEGNRFGVRLVRPGMGYGVDDKIIFRPGDDDHRAALPDDLLVEFYDMRYTDRFGERGQFVSRYYRSTLMESDGRYGLNLDGGVRAWSVDVDAMQQVYRLLGFTYQQELEQLQEEQRT